MLKGCTGWMLESVRFQQGADGCRFSTKKRNGGHFLALMSHQEEQEPLKPPQMVWTRLSYQPSLTSTFRPLPVLLCLTGCFLAPAERLPKKMVQQLLYCVLALALDLFMPKLAAS